ncbi:MAG TPA: DUF4340 domain-containing protein [Ignavibacteria bacterium]|nr:DUF4340 domain-containing protein [Ignavibacteria bacterium]
MKSKTYLYLGILAALLIAAYFLTTDRGEKTSSYKLTEKKLFDLDSAKVDKIEVKHSGGDLIISKATGEWRIESPFQYRTVSANVENIVGGLKNLKIESIVSTNPGKKDTYGFTETDQAEVSVYESGVLKGTFLLGKSAQGGGIQTYIKKTDSDNIYLADGLDRNNVVKTNMNEWKDKNIISIPKQGVNSVEFISSGETFTVSKDSSGKFSIGSDTVGTAFDGILNLLQKFDTNNFRDTTLSEQTNFTEKIIVNGPEKTQINFLKLDTAPAKYLVKLNGDNQIYELDEGYAKNLLKTKKEILGR